MIQGERSESQLLQIEMNGCASGGQRDEDQRLDLYHAWLDGDYGSYTKLVAELLPKINGMAIGLMPLEFDVATSVAGEAIVKALEIAKVKGRFNSLKGFNCYIMLACRGYIHHSIDTSVRLHLVLDNMCKEDEAPEAIWREDIDFWLDYEELKAKLTPRQGDVLLLLERGHTVTDIAYTLRLSRETVRLEVKKITGILAPMKQYFGSAGSGREYGLGVTEDESYE
jgi:hypothetical protein